MAEKMCVILGAGASFDARNAGSPERDARLKPPLAADLFNLELHPVYWNYINRYPGAVNVAQGLAQKSLQRDFNLEQELRRIVDHLSVDIREPYREVPPYLRDLLDACSYDWTHVPSNYVELAKILFGETDWRVLFLVLNYDDLLEQALQKFRENEFKFESMEDYIRADRRAQVVKLHGSTTWFKSIGPAGGDWREQVRQADIFSRPPDEELLVHSSREPVYQIRIGQNHVYPILTAPLAGKGLTAMVCPASHIESAREFLVDCQRFMIIGSSRLDLDLSEMLETSVKFGGVFAQFVCGTEAAGRSSREHFRAGTGVFSTSSAPAGDGVEFRGGLLNYIDSGAALRFAQA